jgi:hypothetical protein
VDKNVDISARFMLPKFKQIWLVGRPTVRLWKRKVFATKKKIQIEKKIEKSSQFERKNRKKPVSSANYSEKFPRFSEKCHGLTIPVQHSAALLRLTSHRFDAL